jgi:hypothetical protein
LTGLLASPITGAALGVVGLVSTVIAALSDATAAAVVTACIFVALTAVVLFALSVNAAFDGPYRIRVSEIEWDLRDPDASEAVCTKRQTVKFNYKTPVVQDTATNDTGVDPFAGYVCEHGTLIATFPRGADHHAIIALTIEAQRDDERVLVSRRTVHDQFPKERGEWIELTQSQRGRTSLTVLWPSSRPPHKPRLWSSRPDREREIDGEVVTEGGRKVYRLKKRRMKRGEVYRISWDWVP